VDNGARSGYEPLLLEALKLYPAWTQSGPKVRTGYQYVGHLAHGWYMRCHRGVEAILLLDRVGYAEEASPIRRSVIEHVLALRWLAAEGDGIYDTVARGHASDVQRRADAVSAAGWTSVDFEKLAEIIAEIDPDSRDSRNDYLRAFAHRLAKYGDHRMLPGYLAECGKTHPGYESAISYVEVPSGLLLDVSDTAVWQVPFAAHELLEALVAVREIFDPKPWRDELKGIVERYKAVTDEVRREDGLAPAEWPTLTDEGWKPQSG